MNKKNIDEQFDSYYNEYSGALYRFCYSRLNCSSENADDCVQEAYIVLYKKLKMGEHFENPRAFLYKTADNFVKRVRKKEAEKASKTASEYEFDRLESKAEQSEIEFKVDFSEFEKALERLLNEEEKQLYDLRYIQWLKLDEISKRLNISEPACAMRLSRLRSKIRRELEEYVPE